MSNIIILDYTDGSVWMYDIKDNASEKEIIDFIRSEGFRSADIEWMIADDISINDKRQFKPVNNNF